MTSTQLVTSAAFKNILVATDFSEASQNALRAAAAIAQSHHSRLLVTHVMEPARPGRPFLVHKPSSFDEGRTAVEYRMQQIEHDDHLRAVSHRETIERGDIRDVISGLIETENIDLLVLGTHARAGLRKVMLGSVAEELFRLAPCPVMTVGPAEEDKPSRFLHRILFATDFGAASREALPYAITLANENAATLILLHVIPPLPALGIGGGWYPGADPEQLLKHDVQQTREKLQQMIPRDSFLVHPPEFRIVFDAVTAGILQTAMEDHADLIVMGVRGKSFSGARTAAHLPWATAHEVVRRASCPVITVRG